MECDTNHSHPCTVEIKNECPPYFFMVWCLVKHRDSFTYMTHTVYEMQIELY